MNTPNQTMSAAQEQLSHATPGAESALLENCHHRIKFNGQVPEARASTEKTLCEKIEQVISDYAHDSSLAATYVCLLLEQEIGLAGNGWFDDDAGMLSFIYDDKVTHTFDEDGKMTATSTELGAALEAELSREDESKPIGWDVVET